MEYCVKFNLTMECCVKLNLTRECCVRYNLTGECCVKFHLTMEYCVKFNLTMECCVKLGCLPSRRHQLKAPLVLEHDEAEWVGCAIILVAPHRLCHRTVLALLPLEVSFLL